jgi:hypothetical protein
MTAAPIPSSWVFSASGFAAGPMRKPGAARLMNWFYETSSLSLVPPVWRIAYPLLIIGLATTICACLGCTVKAQFWGRKRELRSRTPPPPRSGIKHHRSRGIPATVFDSYQSCNQIFAPHLPESARTHLPPRLRIKSSALKPETGGLIHPLTSFKGLANGVAWV